MNCAELIAWPRLPTIARGTHRPHHVGGVTSARMTSVRMTPASITSASVRIVLMLIVGTSAVARVAAAESVSIEARSDKTFGLTRAGGNALTPGPARDAAQPAPGEIMISISTTAAVGRPKLHVYNRYPKAIAFKAWAMNGAKRLASVELCGHLDTDSWIVLPADTTRAVISHIVEIQGDCP